MTGALFSGRGLSKSFGPTQALDNVDFDLSAGEVKGLLGANGAGKSTLLKIMAGALAPDQGELRLDGKPIRLSSMRDAAEQGIALVSQELNLFPALTIAENLRMVGAPVAQGSEGRVLSELGLNAPLNTRLDRLSLGDRQLVEIARALLQQPRVLILDEPTSALHRGEKERLMAVIGQLRRQGVAIVYVSHFLEEVLQIATGLLVLKDGRRAAAEFEPSRDRLDDVVVAMLGQRPAQLAVRAARSPTPEAARTRGTLRIANLRGPRQLRIPSWNIEGGSVVGVSGLAGAGVEELFALLFGRVAPRAGSIALPSGGGTPSSPSQAVKSGVAYVPADRKRVGLMLNKSIVENVCSVRSLVQQKDGFVLRFPLLADITRARCREVGVKAASVKQPAGALSGGNQQKVVFAKWLEADPSLVLLDDPTRGVDIGAKAEMHAIIRRLADEGRVVLMYSSDPLELVTVADRVHVFVDGEHRDELSGPRLTEHDLVAAMNLKTARAG